MRHTRSLIAAAIVLVSGGCAPDHMTAPAEQPQASNHAAVDQWASTTNPPMFVVDGHTVQPAAARNLDPHAIASVEVLKGARAVAEYGDAARNGVVVITLKPHGDVMPAPAGQTGLAAPQPAAEAGISSHPLFIVDGKVVDAAAGRGIDPATIAQVEVLKGPAAVQAYGPAAAEGAIVITLKHATTGR